MFSRHLWVLNRRAGNPGGWLDAVWLDPIADVAPHGAVFKPTCGRCKHPAAAREKIASDLAYDLGIPAAPVLLCDSGGRFGAQQEECCVSMVTHPKTPPWSAVFSAPFIASPAGQLLRASASRPMSQIAAFDLWIENPDRDNAANLVLGEDPSDAAATTFYAFDHDLAMGGSANSWKDDGWQDMAVGVFP